MTAGDIGKYVRASGRKTEEVLRTVVNEEVMARLATSKFGPVLWLTSYVAKDGNYGKRLSYFYRRDSKVLRADGFAPGQDLNAPGFALSFLSYIKVLMAPDFIVEEKSLALHKGRLTAELSVSIEAMHTPLILTFVENAEDIFPEKTEFTPRFGGKTVELFTYPFENICADDYGDILARLEFMNDLSPFEEIYSIITANACDGTGFLVRLRASCEQRNVPFTASRLEKFRELAENKALIKKWDKRQKKASGTPVAWPDLIGTLYAFLSPVWEAILEEKVFFGDWMPELSRYLDG